ncbi:WD40 repeat domain-containing protein [Streptomyces lavendulae]
MWDVADRKAITTLAGHTGSVWSVAFSPDGTLLAAGGSNNTIQVWKVP